MAKSANTFTNGHQSIAATFLMPSRLFTLLLLMAGCAPEGQAPTPVAPRAEPARPAVAAPVETDRVHYQMREGPFGPEATIITTLKAPADRKLYVINCNGAVGTGLQQFVENKWVPTAWAQGMSACFSQPIIIPPGGRRTKTLVVQSGEQSAVEWRRDGSGIEGGTYRVFWSGIYTSFDTNSRPFGEEIALAQRVSAPFTIAPPAPHDPAFTSPRRRPTEIVVAEPDHGRGVTGRTPVRVRFVFPESAQPDGRPYLHVDAKPVGEAEVTIRAAGGPPRSLELEHTPRTAWAPGRHDIRVNWQDHQRNTRWFAWSFYADGRGSPSQTD